MPNFIKIRPCEPPFFLFTQDRDWQTGRYDGTNSCSKKFYKRT